MNKDEALKIAKYVLECYDQEVPTNACKDAIQACKEALEQPALTDKGWIGLGKEQNTTDTYQIQPVQEPVSLGDFDKLSKSECVDYIEYLRKEIDWVCAIEQALKEKNT